MSVEKRQEKRIRHVLFRKENVTIIRKLMNDKIMLANQYDG